MIKNPQPVEVSFVGLKLVIYLYNRQREKLPLLYAVSKPMQTSEFRQNSAHSSSVVTLFSAFGEPVIGVVPGAKKKSGVAALSS